jgi:hypothetical protein
MDEGETRKIVQRVYIPPLGKFVICGMDMSKPFLPADRRASNHLVRAAFVAARAKLTPHKDAAELAAQLYPKDEATLAVLTKATAPLGTTTGSGWANHLVQTAVADFLGALGQQSAAAVLMSRGVRLDATRTGQINVPIRSTAPASPSWVVEGSPIPVRSDVLASVQLGPARELGAIVVLSRELMKRSDAARVFGLLLREDAAKALDGAVWSEEDGNGDAHEGLLNSATEVTGSGYLLSDLQALASAVSVNGSGQVVFIGSPALAAAAGVDASISATILPSPAVADRLIGVDPLSLIWGSSEDFEIDASTEGLVHMSDDPLPIVASGVTADPTRSLYQSDAIALRLLLPVAFAARRSGAVAYVDNVSYW